MSKIMGRPPKWLSGKTKNIRIPIVLIEKCIEILRKMDGRKPEDVQVHITYKDEE